MNFAGEFTVGARREAVFAALEDARFFASCLDGVGDLTQIDETRYGAIFETKVAYMRFRFNVIVEFLRIEVPREIEARIEGVPHGLVGRLTATSVTRLADAGEATTVQYAIDATLTGKLGGLGQPVLRAKAKEMEKQFTNRLRAAFEQPAPAEGA